MKLPKVTSQHMAESSVILAGKRDTHHFRQERMISVASCKRDTKSKSHPGMKLACEFSHVNTPLHACCLLTFPQSLPFSGASS